MLRNLPLTARLSLIFFAFTMVNIILFWLATGSNQMRLLAENASLRMHRTILSFGQDLQTMAKAGGLRQRAEFYRTPAAANLMTEILQTGKDRSGATLTEYDVVSSLNQVYLSWPKANDRNELSAAEMQNVIKTLRLREFNNEPFYSFPDVLNYRLTVYIPFVNDRGQDLLVRAVFTLESMRAELGRLMRVGISIVVILLLIQVALGLFLYRLVVRPLKDLETASKITGKGNYHQIGGYQTRKDEIGTLIGTFNKMSTDLRDQKETIRKSYAEIQSRDEQMQHELMIAQHIQKSIFPRGENPHATAIEFRPLFAVSGDFYDVYRFADGSAGYLVCDASGHGVPAALLTMMAKSAFANFVQLHNDPGKVMQLVNEHLAASLEMTGQYLTAFYVRVYADRIEYCNATHPEPILLQAGSDEPLPLKSNGFYIGMLGEPPFAFESAQLPVAPGSKLFIFTDGITEARNAGGELYGTQRITETVRRLAAANASSARDQLLEDLAVFCGNTPAEDDLTLLVIEV